MVQFWLVQIESECDWLSDTGDHQVEVTNLLQQDWTDVLLYIEHLLANVTDRSAQLYKYKTLAEH